MSITALVVTLEDGIGRRIILHKNADVLCDKLTELLKYGSVAWEFLENDPCAMRATKPFLDLKQVQLSAHSAWKNALEDYNRERTRDPKSKQARWAAHEAKFRETAYLALTA